MAVKSENTTKPEKSLKYFMRPYEEEVVTVKGPDTIKDENGEVIYLEIRKLTQECIEKITESYHTRNIAKDKKGNPYVNGREVLFISKRDGARANRHIIAEALKYPNLKDKELMEYFNCYDFTDMPLKVFPTVEEYEYVLKAVFSVIGVGDFENPESDKEDIESAKN